MCGIVGAVGKLDIKEFLLKGLSDLDYRGYDSAGIALYNKDGIEVIKNRGSVDLLRQHASSFKKPITCGIGHTRWATHGEPSDVNAHPISSETGEYVIVHNGVVENFNQLKTKLVAHGFSFKTKTDTEVIANYLEYASLQKGLNPLASIKRMMDRTEGSFALAILHKGEEDRIYFVKVRSPLLIGKTPEATLLGSDALPMAKSTNKFVDLVDYTYGYVTKDEIHLFQDEKEIKVSYVSKQLDLLTKDLNGYPHYMLKEIEECPLVISRLVNNYFDNGVFSFDKNLIKALNEATDIIFIACGTSYHASLIGKRYFQNIEKRVDAYIASEWAYFPVFQGAKPLYILISQSGETADLIRCQQILNDRGALNVAITNSKGSTIDRNATFSLFLYAGLEVAVASTKAYVAQVCLLALLTNAVSKKNSIVTYLDTIIDSQKKIIEQREEIKKIANKIKDQQMIFFVGRGLDYDVALEASLKFKEITYIHSEAISSGELKHGPIALISKDVPVFAFTSDPLVDAALRNNCQEMETRGADIFIISSSALRKDGDSFSNESNLVLLEPLLKSIFAFYLAYYTALLKGKEIDKPRNLAKSVTVE